MILNGDDAVGHGVEAHRAHVVIWRWLMVERDGVCNGRSIVVVIGDVGVNMIGHFVEHLIKGEMQRRFGTISGWRRFVKCWLGRGV